MSPADAQQRLQGAVAALRQGRPDQARAFLEPLAQAEPRLADARRLLGMALKALGDLAKAEGEFRAAAAADKRQPLTHVALAEVLAQQGKVAEAERAYRAALALDRRFPPAAVGLSTLLLDMGRAEDALQATTPLAVGATADEAVLTAHANGLKAMSRLDEAERFNARAVAAAPASAVAEHNHAATLGDLGRSADAEAAARRALSKGGDAPETWLVRARALQQLTRLDEAEAAYAEALRRRPAYLDAHSGLSQLIWMRTEDARAATRPLDAALAAGHRTPQLIHQKMKVLKFAGDKAGALALAREALAQEPGSVALNVAAVNSAIEAGEPEFALACAAQAIAAAPGERAALQVLCEASLAVGDAARAGEAAAGLLRLSPDDQYAVALRATAWRLLDDPRFSELYDYASFVRGWTLDTPDGWPTLDAYLDDLAPALNRVHQFRTHPLDQSLRHGSQAPDLRASDEPAIQAFFQAVDGPIRRHIAALGKGRDRLRKRSLGGYRMAGAWSVRLRPNGFHTDHVHPEGWLSSACYIRLPRAVEGVGREGWIKFGEPGPATRPPLPPQHFVKPAPGMLVLFPSYMWHGTVPFGGEEPRLTVAFDLVPAKA